MCILPKKFVYYNGVNGGLRYNWSGAFPKTLILANSKLFFFWKLLNLVNTYNTRINVVYCMCIVLSPVSVCTIIVEIVLYNVNQCESLFWFIGIMRTKSCLQMMHDSCFPTVLITMRMTQRWVWLLVFSYIIMYYVSV